MPRALLQTTRTDAGAQLAGGHSETTQRWWWNYYMNFLTHMLSTHRVTGLGLEVARATILTYSRADRHLEFETDEPGMAVSLVETKSILKVGCG